MSMSGYDANSNFGCKAPDGVLCESMSGIYANAEQNNLPGQRVHHGNDVSVSADSGTGAVTVAAAATATGTDKVVMSKPLNSGTPLRSAPHVLRIWFAPWEDTDGDLHDQSYVYLTVDSGHWLVEHNRRRIQDTYKPVHAPSKLPVPSTGNTEAGSNVHVTSDQALNSISAIQSRSSPEEAAALMDGIKTPGQRNGL
jgi:conjugal transfer pilus assembly protein TraV